MASFNITGLSTTAQTLNSGELGFISPEGSLVIATGTAVSVNGGGDLVNLGNIVARFSGVTLNSNGTVQIGARGSITSTESNAVDISGSDGPRSIINNGTLTGFVSGIGWSTIAHGAETYETRLVNTGIIIGQSDIGVRTVVEGGATPGTSTADNSGTISGLIVGLSLDTIIGPGGTFRVVNSGLIEGRNGAGIRDGSYAANVDIVNSGRILSGDVGGSFMAIEMITGGVTRVINTGQIIGNVELHDGADVYRGTGGVVSGYVDGEGGQDTLVGGAGDEDLRGGDDNDLLVGHGGDDTLLGGTGNDTLSGGDGGDSLDGGSEDDRMFGGSGDDEMKGGSGNDTLNSGEGDDTVEGEEGNDIVLGQAGVDFLVGATGNDTLDGGEGDDSLFAGADNDVLRGRGGIDYMDGGLGRDVMEGGPDADLFIFNNILDSTPDANRDVILDFEKGIDTINLVNVVPGVFVFRGTQAFTATGGPELRLFVTGDSTIVRMDTDGNGLTDMEIRIAGVTGLTAADFDL